MFDRDTRSEKNIPIPRHATQRLPSRPTRFPPSGIDPPESTRAESAPSASPWKRPLEAPSLTPLEALPTPGNLWIAPPALENRPRTAISTFSPSLFPPRAIGGLWGRGSGGQLPAIQEVGREI